VRSMTTDQIAKAIPTIGNGAEQMTGCYQKIKFFRSPGGAGILVQRWIEEDGTEGNVSIRLSRKKKNGEWDNLTLYETDLHYIKDVIDEMRNCGLLEIGKEISFD
jgi:hypothetical protein